MNNIEILKEASRIRKEEFGNTISQKEAYKIAKERLVNGHSDVDESDVNKQNNDSETKNVPLLKKGNYVKINFNGEHPRDIFGVVGDPSAHLTYVVIHNTFIYCDNKIIPFHSRFSINKEIFLERSKLCTKKETKVVKDYINGLDK